ncbi:GNAT family N-acetyltransferase [Eoetvoesiella caeni]|uniref:L-ornithine N(alpha)-acyltransferase n=1 Tax=Eoetvoesiella caeni TaxID=645616 RepID=A0A366H9J4_9BURK|nr:GNAT family N-acyltransferase [Eoetvoesiella caeni]MCI2809582.1 GNAT family N-acetyltransferase [Eoetvoesiella caeni]NYT56078.1 GNAT family N-acetyltransferase [Eoetvoesiella caeni]RBP38843.1 ornithine-acyl[acyl carrier protein] N-acyltransferase [Eoetvoesiella caeni]
MIELARVLPDASNSAAWPNPTGGGLVLGLARTNEELEAIQRMRYKIFTEDMNVVFPEALDGVDSDRFDPWCEHIMVKEVDSGRVVGTYRLLSPANAVKAGGYYSESEFDISSLDSLRGQMAEVGRSCIHADYRNGSVIMLLWSGIAALMQQDGFRYVLGCASVSLRDDGVTAAEVWRLARKMLNKNTGQPIVEPRHRYPVERLNSELPARVPPLIKGYLKLGATICGEPAWDPDFNAADFPILLDLESMDPRYRRHFGLA